MRLDRDSKQPIWLGLILIFAAFIFTLFFITRVHASEVSTFDFNNVIIISGTGQRISFCFADGSWGLRFSFNPTDEDDGYNIYTYEQFEQRFNDFFAYVLASQTYIVFYDDYVAKGTYEYLQEYFLSKGCGWVLTSATFPMTFDDSFSLMQGHAGKWFFPYYTRSVPLTPTVTPSPTPVPETFNFIIKQERSSSEVAYYFFEFEASDFGKEVSLSTSYSLISTLVNNFSVYPIASVPTFVFRTGERFNTGYENSSGTAFYFTASSVSNCYVYNLGGSLVSSDPDYIKSNYSGTLLSLSFDSTSGGNILTHSSVYPDIYCLRSVLNQGKGDQYLVSSNILEYSILSFSFSGSKTLSPFNLNGSDSDTFYFLGFQGLLSGSSIVQNPDVSPTPSPSATPEPLPTSSESIHVILPTGTPTPTPPFSVPAEDPGGGSGYPGGSYQGSLTPGQVNSTLNTFKQYTQNNGAFAFLYACTSLIPDDALYFLFILLFILLLLACLRLFVHFTGG